MSDSRRWAWPLLIGVLAAIGILLAIGDIAAGAKWPNPMSDALVGPGVVVKTGVPASATPGTQTVRFDRTGVAEKFIFE